MVNLKIQIKKIMTKFKILTEFIKDMSSETQDVQTYLYVKEYISKYQLTIDITSKPTKNRLIEVNTILKFKDNENNEKKSHFEMTYTSIVEFEGEIKEKKELEKAILCDVQKKIYPNVEKAFINLLNNSGFGNISFKKVDFEKLYKERSN